MSTGALPGGTNTIYAGALVLLEQHTASSSATLDFTTCVTSTYDTYVIECVNVLPATNNVSLLMRMSTNGGSSYDSGSNYRYALFFQISTVTAPTGSDSTTSITVCGSVSSSTSEGGCVASYRLYNPLDTTAYKKLIGQSSGISTSNGNVIDNQNVGAAYKSASAVDAFQFLFSSGNIASGTIRVYGLAK